MGISLKICTAAAAAVIAFSSVASAEDVKLPDTLAWSAYNTGTTGYNQSVAIGKALIGGRNRCKCWHPQHQMPIFRSALLPM